MNTTKKATIGIGVVLLGLFTAGQGFPIHRAALAHPWAAIGAFLLAAAMVGGRRGERLEAAFDALCRVRRAWFNLGAFAAGVGIYGATAWYVFGGIPRIDDGVASLFQARLFARGAATIPLPEMSYFYNIFGVLGFRQGVEHWCGMYPPGWPALLTPGVWAGAPWLVNPVPLNRARSASPPARHSDGLAQKSPSPDVRRHPCL